MSFDIVDRLRADPGRRTLGELVQEREAAMHEIVRLRSELERWSARRAEKAKAPEFSQRDLLKSFRPGTLIRIQEVCELLGTSRSSIYRWVKKGTFPAPVHVSESTVRWSVDAIQAWRESL